MTTQEERMTDVEKNLTILLGIASGQERDIRSIQVGVMGLEKRLDAVDGRLYSLEKRFDTFEQNVTSSIETQNKKLDQILLLLNPTNE